MNTLKLDSGWDLTIDPGTADIAVQTGTAALAQDAASAIRLRQKELYYDTTKGVPYLTQIIGRAPNVPLMKSKFVSAASTVPGVVSAKCFISSITDRAVRGQVQVTDKGGTTTAVNF